MKIINEDVAISYRRLALCEEIVKVAKMRCNPLEHKVMLEDLAVAREVFQEAVTQSYTVNEEKVDKVNSALNIEHSYQYDNLPEPDDEEVEQEVIRHDERLYEIMKP